MSATSSTSASVSTIATPGVAVTHSARASLSAQPLDPTDSFFGYTFSISSTHESRHDSIAFDVPPPYVEESGLPAYTPYAEPVTLAMYLFKFGFLFPPFWIFGAFILLSPLREPPSASDSTPAWMPEKTEAERQQIIAKMRKVELKWARRSLYALLILIGLAASAGAAAWMLLKHH